MSTASRIEKIATFVALAKTEVATLALKSAKLQRAIAEAEAEARSLDATSAEMRRFLIKQPEVNHQ